MNKVYGKVAWKDIPVAKRIAIIEAKRERENSPEHRAVEQALRKPRTADSKTAVFANLRTRLLQARGIAA